MQHSITHGSPQTSNILKEKSHFTCTITSRHEALEAPSHQERATQSFFMEFRAEDEK